jgi:hypothetical protein
MVADVTKMGVWSPVSEVVVAERGCEFEGLTL